MNTKRPKIAFVVQRSGNEVNGGAEALCLSIAKRMVKYWDLDILTTCALDYVTWDNHYKEGLENVDGVPVRRFKVDRPRNLKKFNKSSATIVNKKDASHRAIEKWMKLQGPDSSGLLNFIRRNKDNYDYFIFFTYLYASTYYGLKIVEDKAILVPAAHDEWTIYFSIWDDWFKKARALIFSTPEEQKFVEKRFGKLSAIQEIIGVGLNFPTGEVSEERFRKTYNITDPYIVYVGRIDENKGCGELFGFFQKYKLTHNNNLKLVLIGKSVMPIPGHDDIIPLGFVDEQTKYDAIMGSSFLINPSIYESLSIVLLEAWYYNRPVLVNEKCEVMVGQCKRSNGGLWYSDYNEFELCVNYLLEDKRIGVGAKQFVENTYGWDVITEKYLSLINSLSVNSSVH